MSTCLDIFRMPREHQSLIDFDECYFSNNLDDLITTLPYFDCINIFTSLLEIPISDEILIITSEDVDVTSTGIASIPFDKIITAKDKFLRTHDCEYLKESFDVNEDDYKLINETLLNFFKELETAISEESTLIITIG